MEYTLVTLVKAVVDVALLCILGQAIMFVFAGANREKNFVYRLFAIVTRPVFVLVGWLTPSFVGRQFHGLIAFFLLFWTWIALIVAKCWFCVTTIGQCQRGCYILLALLGYVPK